MQKTLIFLSFGTTFFALGFAASSIFYNEKIIQSSEIRAPGNYKFINPLLSCDTPFTNQDVNTSRLKHKVEQIVEDQINKKQISFASVYYRDMNNGPWFGIEEKELFSPASLIKVPLMIAYFKQAENDPNFLHTKLANNVPHDPSQNIIPSTTLTPNQEYTIEELIERMIKYSDNDAYYLLHKNMREENILRIYADLGIDLSPAVNNPGGNIISVKNYASFFRVLFNASYLNPEMSEKALAILNQSEYKDGIVNGLPKNTIVAHKFGERQYEATGDKQLHDCGIVYSSSNPYLICIMTRGREFSKMSRTVQQISSEIHRQLSL
jgi:beta-lactamase class A